MDILEILGKYGVEIPEDKKSDFDKDFRVNFKSAGEHKKVKDSLTEAQNKLNSNADFEGKYNTLVRKYEADIAEKQKVIDNMTFDNKLNKALVGVEFVNGRVRDSVLGEIRSKNFKINEAGTIEGLDDYLKTLRTNEPDIFKAPDNKANTFAGGSSNNTNPGTGEIKNSWVI